MTSPAWYPDPFKRHDYRYWDGDEWTEEVSDDGVQTVDPVQESESADPPEEQTSANAVRQSQQADAAPILASKWKRLGAQLMDCFLLKPITLWIGWFVWSVIIWERGQTPAKQIFGMRVMVPAQKQCAGRGRMLLREWILKGDLVGVLFFLSLLMDIEIAFVLMAIWSVWWIASIIMLLADHRHRAGWDRVLGTVVINDLGTFDPRRNEPANKKPRAW